jgi:hypothetical protein
LLSTGSNHSTNQTRETTQLGFIKLSRSSQDFEIASLQIPQQQTVPLKTFCRLHKTRAKILEPLKEMFLREANLEQQQRSYELFLLFFPPSEWTKGSTNNSNNPPNFPAPQKRFIMTCDYPRG